MRICGSSLILLAATCGMAGCSSQDTALVKPAEIVQQPATVVQKRQPQVSPLRRKALALLEKKQYLQAIELMNGRYHEGLEKEYIQAINGLLDMGDDAFSLGDYATAAHAFKGVLNAYPVETSLRERIRHNPKRLRSNMETCINRMMEQGLEEYRRGRLESAIGKWKVLLTINPGHKEAKKALNTATIQLQALQNLKNK
jgi:tetratricopeptide (TPR) repeat protein